MRTTIFKITLAALVISGLSACGTSTAPSAAGHDTPASIDNEAAECILKSPHLQVGTTPDLVLNGVTYTNSHQPDAKSAIEMPIADPGPQPAGSCDGNRSEEHTSELQSLMRISYAVFCLKTKKTTNTTAR